MELPGAYDTIALRRGVAGVAAQRIVSFNLSPIDLNSGCLHWNRLVQVVTRELAFVWDYDIDEAEFRALLAGEMTYGRLNRDWAAVRLLDYGAYSDIVRLLGFAALVQG